MTQSSRIGYVLDGKYEILSEIGRGGMSIVYLARDRRLNKLWAIKEFQQTGEQLKDSVFRESLLIEANLMKSLDHAALPRIVDIIEADDTIFIVMDYIEGENLKKVMERQGHPMAQKDVIDWGIQLCDVLDYLHTPDPKKNKPAVVYRDMKPENVMLKDDGSVCLIDFGIARKFDERKNKDTTILGTREYAAPEQFDASVQTDYRADIYSLGVTLHYLVTGHNPKKSIFKTRPIREYNPQLSEGLEAVIAKCVRYDRAERYQSCREVAYDLEHHETLTESYRNRLKSKLHTFIGLAVASVVFLAVGVFGITMSSVEKASTFESYLARGNGIALADADAAGGAAYDEKVAAYASALNVDPSKAEPYEQMLDTFIADGQFSSDEADAYYKLMEDSAKRNCADYARLCYNFANVYFCYTTNYAQASMWFANAQEAGGLSDEMAANAATYMAICDFRKDLDSRDKLGNSGESEAFVEYWNRLGEACESLENANVTPRSKLKLYELIMDACSSEAYTIPFMIGGLSERDVSDRVEYAYTHTVQLEEQVASAIDRELYDYIVLHYEGGTDESGANIEAVPAVIERTYSSAYNTAKGSNDTTPQNPSTAVADGSVASEKDGER